MTIITLGSSRQDTLTMCAMVLQLLLGYLPPDQRQWEAILTQKRAEYARFCKVTTQFCISRLLYWGATVP